MSVAHSAMRAQRAPWLLAALLWPLMAVGAPSGATTRASGALTEPTAWVERIRQAASQRSYVGTLVYAAGDVVSSSRVARMGSADQVVERIEALDGRQQRSIRQNGKVHTIWPDQRLVTIERGHALDELTGMPLLDPSLQQHYDMRLLGQERLAGRDASVLLLRPRDDWRFAQRLWVDSATGLLLRADVLGPQGQTLESSAFSDIEIDPRPPREGLANALKRLDGYRVIQVPSEPTSLESEGWTVDKLPAGFRLLGCVQRSMGEPPVEGGPAATRALQAVFSDGLARVSVFIEQAQAQRPRQALMTQLGATHTLMKPRDTRWWITVMGDVPASTLKAFSDGVVRSRP